METVLIGLAIVGAMTLLTIGGTILVLLFAFGKYTGIIK